MLWSSGMTSRCGRASPGSIPGSASISFSFLPFLPFIHALYFFAISKYKSFLSVSDATHSNSNRINSSSAADTDASIPRGKGR